MTDAKLMAERLFDRIEQAGIVLRDPPFAVNLGCGDGKSQMDPVYPLFMKGFVGLAVDGGNAPALEDNLGHLPVKLRASTWITAENIVALLRQEGCPPNLEFLKMDIDGVDASVLKAILRSGYRPLVIQMELNPEIPPPLAFCVLPHPEFRSGGPTGFFGCSLAYAVDMMAGFDYVAVEIDFKTDYTHDALFVQRSMLSWGIGLEAIHARDEFLANRPIIPHLKTVTQEAKIGWRKQDDFAALLVEVWTAMSEANEQKHGHRKVPFELYLSEVEAQPASLSPRLRWGEHRRA